MKYCDKCHVDVVTNQQYCPLCHQVLKGEADPAQKEIYPEFVPLTRGFLPLIKKIILFVTMVSIVTLFTVNLLTYNETDKLWSLIPIGSTLYLFFILRFGLLTRQNIAFRLAILTTVLIIILNVIDTQYAGNQGWALDYVTPLALLSCNIAISIIILVKRINYRDYIFYLLTIVVFSLIPLILVLFNVIEEDWPSIAAFGVAVFILLVIIFFFPKSIKEEFKKRFHI
jgi:lysylphosphatidylglycerol synthetase-like protein (DUF2156 family)